MDDNTHAELIEDLAHAAVWRFLGRPKGRTAYHAFLVLRDAHEALGGLRLARAEDWQDAERECSAALSLSLSIATATGMTLGGIGTTLRAVCARL